MLQFGARGYQTQSYQEGTEAFRRPRKAQFVAIVTPGVKDITAALAHSA